MDCWMGFSRRGPASVEAPYAGRPLRSTSSKRWSLKGASFGMRLALPELGKPGVKPMWRDVPGSGPWTTNRPRPSPAGCWATGSLSRRQGLPPTGFLGGLGRHHLVRRAGNPLNAQTRQPCSVPVHRGARQLSPLRLSEKQVCWGRECPGHPGAAGGEGTPPAQRSASAGAAQGRGRPTSRAGE